MRTLVLVLIAATATAAPVKAPVCRTKAKKPVHTIKDVDWCNFDYGGGKDSRLHDGHSSLHLYSDLGEAHDTIGLSLRGVIYGNVDGDKALEAAIVLERSMSTPTGDRPSSSTTIALYKLVKSVPTRIGSIPATSPVVAVALAKDTVAVTGGKPKTTQRYRRAGDDFELIVE